MKFTATALALFVSSTSATWCNFFFDAGCTNDANGGTSFDCANTNAFASAGGFVMCHRTSGNSDPCTISRFSGQPGADGTSQTNSFTVDIPPGGDGTACTGTGGGGPWYQLAIQ